MRNARDTVAINCSCSWCDWSMTALSGVMAPFLSTSSSPDPVRVAAGPGLVGQYGGNRQLFRTQTIAIIV